ncbi:LLM class flavin-dependent oxidoreductase [Actinophytocola gossypii]|uniref:LLM class flavin-dependent oxidoreductase n=1 Tax=Actinophytocola gossypii TaxID=2812003 RepID=A0ABT2JHZ0_9PSEU|nr:LLM class flavin-dependent oxidoreductase [Actinophytocola gossypii]MCT2587134.1 LLM class flavin-dependent oxidoreductase [Actinophytocola gossypii]
MTELGVVFRPQLPPERLRGVVEAAETSGLAELWLWEDCPLTGGIATLAATLAWTSRLRVGIGILPLPLRPVITTAMETATLARLFPDRLTLGVGHGAQDWMAKTGVRPASPLTLMREHLTALTALLDGETVTEDGRHVRLDGVGLDWPPARRPPILVGATKERSLRLSGELADGTVLDQNQPPAAVRRARAAIDEGRAAAGRTDRHELVVYLWAATGPDATERLRRELAEWGVDEVPGLGAAGNADAVAAGVRELAEAGADRVVLVHTADEPDLAGFVRFAAEEVAPLVR